MVFQVWKLTLICADPTCNWTQVVLEVWKFDFSYTAATNNGTKWFFRCESLLWYVQLPLTSDPSGSSGVKFWLEFCSSHSFGPRWFLYFSVSIQLLLCVKRKFHLVCYCVKIYCVVLQSQQSAKRWVVRWALVHFHGTSCFNEVPWIWTRRLFELSCIVLCFLCVGIYAILWWVACLCVAMYFAAPFILI